MRILLKPKHRQELCALYSEPHRAYHTMEHIAIMLNTAAAHGIKLSIPQTYAIWYHDAIYSPTRKDNEERSAELFLNHNETLHPELKDRVVGIILDTKTHVSENHESQVVLDLDMTGFGFDYETFQYTTGLVRQEYNHLPDDVWRANRKLFLYNILNREYIFHTHWGRDFYEVKARKNIRKELSSL